MYSFNFISITYRFSVLQKFIGQKFHTGPVTYYTALLDNEETYPSLNTYVICDWCFFIVTPLSNYKRRKNMFLTDRHLRMRDTEMVSTVNELNWIWLYYFNLKMIKLKEILTGR